MISLILFPFWILTCFPNAFIFCITPLWIKYIVDVKLIATALSLYNCSHGTTSMWLLQHPPHPLHTHTAWALLSVRSLLSRSSWPLKTAVFVPPATSLLPSIAKCKWSRRQMRKGQWTLIKHLFFTGTPGFIVLCLIALCRCCFFMNWRFVATLCCRMTVSIFSPIFIHILFFPIPITSIVTKSSQLYKINLMGNKLLFTKECADSQEKTLLLLGSQSRILKF